LLVDRQTYHDARPPFSPIERQKAMIDWREFLLPKIRNPGSLGWLAMKSAGLWMQLAAKGAGEDFLAWGVGATH
jgi:hypothetical protein